MEEVYAERAAMIVTQMTLGTPASVSVVKESDAVRKAAEAITSSLDSSKAEHGRNDHVIITNGTETQEMKYKKAEPLIESGQWRIVEGKHETRLG